MKAKLSIIVGGGGEFFVNYQGSLWRIEENGQIGADKDSQKSFVELLSTLVAENRAPKTKTHRR